MRKPLLLTAVLAAAATAAMAGEPAKWGPRFRPATLGKAVYAAARAAVPRVVIVDLATLAPVPGTLLPGAAADQRVGSAVAAAGDVNNDGIDDYVIGATGASHLGIAGAGAAYVVFGKTGVLPSSIVLPPAAGAGFTINGAYASGALGFSVAGAGDTNLDGYDDLIVSEITGATGDTANAYVVYGKASSTSVNLGTLTLTQGRSLSVGSRQPGKAVTVAGGFDFNKDGYDDVAVGSPGTASGLSDAGSGRVYVVYGRSTATAQNIQLKMLGAGGGVEGFEVYTLQSGFSLGETLASAGDFDGDGYGDLLFGGTGATPTYGPVGTYVLLGRAGMPARTDAGSLPAIVNDGSSDQLGFSVGGGTDADGDGYDDIVIGAPSATVDGIGAAGRAWVIYGSRRPAFRVPVATLPATRGVRIDPEGHSDGLGMVTAMTGDLNGDGRGDVALGIPVASIFPRVSNGGGYVVFGRSAFTAPVDLQMLDGLNGFYVDGKAETRAGKTMAGAGDVDRDGFADLLIGAPSADVGANVDAGTVYLVRGRAVAAINRIGTEDGELMAGSPDNDTLDAAAGDDTLSARDGNDALIGGPGADRHYGGAGNDVIRFRDVAESPTLAASDIVFDFAPAADQFDVSPIDASVLAAGNNAFTFVGTAAFTGAAQLRYRQVDAAGTANDYTIVEASTDADVTPELVVRLKGLMTLTSGNFVR